ncbi:hypothetical protein [Peribacillus huizhouensis]|uniref:VCBS repeat-containing protein n=1 Tax=Peribacillus huizhouensis TaxID=1501239 RepID=A0ABR6CMT9_9BACI|nr:hypothetical protein [Peribacillus huizhouensis]MBA9026333.1 hypothetical protein [Peribacillus huizhouensis]
MKKIILLFILIFGILNLSQIFVYADSEQNKEFIQIVKEFIPSNSLLVSPENPLSTQPIQQYDFNQDGQKEIIITYEIKAKDQPSPSQYGVILLKKEQKSWIKIWETEREAVGLHFSGFADITGDGINEYLFGWTIGASAGNQLEIFKWTDRSFKMIAKVPYHKLDLLNENKKVALAVWQRYIADTYFVDVLTWNGEKLILNAELYSRYYPKIKRFFDAKISKMDAWFYWYCLADAQLKANLLDEASDSIQKGSMLAKKLSMPDVIQNFKELSKRLKEKKISHR